MDSNKMNKVNVVGWYNQRNAGDESYKISFPMLFPDYQFTFSEKILDEYDIYILGGGDCLNENILNKFSKITKPKHIMSVTVSKEFDPKLFDNYKNIIVRDEESCRLLSKIGIKSELYPDFSVCLEYSAYRGNRLINWMYNRDGHDLYNKKIAIVINSHLLPLHNSPSYENSRFEKFANDLAITIDNVPASFIFIPFSTKQPWDDRISNGIVSHKCKWWKKNITILNEMTVRDTIDILSACDACISSRLHSSIFSAITEVPFIDVSHSHKNKYFLNTIKYEKASFGYIDYNPVKSISYLKELLIDDTKSYEIGSIMSLHKLMLKEMQKRINL